MPEDAEIARAQAVMDRPDVADVFVGIAKGMPDQPGVQFGNQGVGDENRYSEINAEGDQVGGYSAHGGIITDREMPDAALNTQHLSSDEHKTVKMKNADAACGVPTGRLVNWDNDA